MYSLSLIQFLNQIPISECYFTQIQHKTSLLPILIYLQLASYYCVIIMPFYIGVQLTFKGTIYRNNSLFFLNELGNNVLQCISDKAGCCVPPNRFGEWFYPNGSKIPPEYYGTVFYRNRGHDGDVNLNYHTTHQDIPPTGNYCCRVPNAADVYQTVCANILCKASIVTILLVCSDKVSIWCLENF